MSQRDSRAIESCDSTLSQAQRMAYGLAHASGTILDRRL